MRRVRGEQHWQTIRSFAKGRIIRLSEVHSRVGGEAEGAVLDRLRNPVSARGQRVIASLIYRITYSAEWAAKRSGLVAAVPIRIEFGARSSSSRARRDK